MNSPFNLSAAKAILLVSAMMTTAAVARATVESSVSTSVTSQTASKQVTLTAGSGSVSFTVNRIYTLEASQLVNTTYDHAILRIDYSELSASLDGADCSPWTWSYLQSRLYYPSDTNGNWGNHGDNWYTAGGCLSAWASADARFFVEPRPEDEKSSGSFIFWTGQHGDAAKLSAVGDVYTMTFYLVNGSAAVQFDLTHKIVSPEQEADPSTYGDYPIDNVPFSDVTVNDNFWAARIAQNQQVTIPIALKQCYDNGRLDNFKKAAGAMEGYFKGEYTFDDTDIYKIVEGMSYSIQANYSKSLDDEMDMIISCIAKAQESDGYLMTARTAAEPGKMHSWLGTNRWEKDPDLSHELYNCGHLYEAAVAHYISTGKTTLLDVAVKNADLLVKDFLVGGLTYEPGHQIVEMGLVKLYRVTGKEDYLKLAKYFLDLRGDKGTSRQEYNQTHTPVTSQAEAVGHAVRAGYMYSGMADIAAIMGSKSYSNAIDRLWNNVVGKKLYITGGIGALQSGESFGANYELPNATAYCETCAAISNVYWNHRMFLLSGDSKYYDVLERTLYNGVISGIGLDGKTFFYPNPLASEGGYDRSEWFGCACCPSNLCRFIPSVPGYAFAHRGDSVYVNLYMQCSALIPLKADTIRLSQESHYPWKGDITVTIDSIGSTKRFQLMLRLPGWANQQPVPSDLYSYVDAQSGSVTVCVNGTETAYTTDKGYMVLDREWTKGDRVTFSLPMPTHRTVANANVAADQGRVSLERGPIVYCLEWVDNNDNVQNSYISDDAEITASWNDSLLGGIMQLNIKGKQMSVDAQGDITDSDANLVAIPYYAWDNRGSKGQMQVWVARYKNLTAISESNIPTDTLEFNPTMERYTDTESITYANTPVQLDKEQIASLLGVSTSELNSLFDSRITYAGVNADGSLNTSSTAYHPGHWFDANGNTCSWGTTAMTFSELKTDTWRLQVGQYPNHCQEGKVYTFMQALTYKPADITAPSHRVVFKTNLHITSAVSAIDEMRLSPARPTDGVFDLCGRKVADAASLSSVGRKGIYIVGGHKVVF